MPPLSEFLNNAEQLRLAVRTTAPREMARYVKQVRRAEYDVDALKRLIDTLIDLYWSECGPDAAFQLMELLGEG